MNAQLKALVISSHIVGQEDTFLSNERVSYTWAPVERDFAPDLTDYDLLIVPNGSDQIAMYKIRAQVQQFLASGKALACFDGWFTDWIPGHRWVMDNSKKTIELRYFLKDDAAGLFEGVNLDHLIFSNGISGWWACGYIEPHPQARVVLEDTWQRPIIVLDEASSPGTIFLTASGPLADKTYATTDDQRAEAGVARLYQNFIDFLIQKKTQIYG